jgi:hypothetical protein
MKKTGGQKSRDRVPLNDMSKTFRLREDPDLDQQLRYGAYIVHTVHCSMYAYLSFCVCPFVCFPA